MALSIRLMGYVLPVLSLKMIPTCDVQLLFRHIWKPISSFVKKNKAYIYCILILRLFAILLSPEGLFTKLQLISPFPDCELNRGVSILFLRDRVRELGEKRGEG